MKKIFYTFTFLVVTSFSTMAQDVAIVGWDAFSGDEFSFVLLRDHTEGEIIYFTEDDYSDFSNDFDASEAHIEYTIPTGGLLENEVITITETGSNTFTVSCAGGTATRVSGSGTWSLVVDGLGGMSDEIYAYSASNTTSPWSSITEIHCFVWSATFNVYGNPGIGGGTTDQIPSFDYLNCIDIAFNIGGSAGVNADFMNSARTNTTLADLQNGVNWSQSMNTNITLSCTDFTTQMIVLPVELIAFEAKEKNENVYLSWITASEINNDYFEIQRSKDGIEFERIGMVNGNGTTALTNHYSFIDEKPINGYNYYRLKQNDFDGNFAYSDIVPVEYRNDNNDVLVYPNPFDQSVTVQFPSSEDNYSDVNPQIIEVYDAFGQLVHRISSNEPMVTLDLSKLSPGAYFLKAFNRQRTIITQRITKF